MREEPIHAFYAAHKPPKKPTKASISFLAWFCVTGKYKNFAPGENIERAAMR